MTEYTGQLIGGPDDGNLITATVAVVPFRCEYVHHLGGVDDVATSLMVVGEYVWDASSGSFNWKLHGSHIRKID